MKKAFFILICAMLLTACGEERISDVQTAEQSTAETHYGTAEAVLTSEEVTAIVTTEPTEQLPETTEPTEQPPETTEPMPEKSGEQMRLEQLILNSIPEEDKRDGYTIGDTLFGDFDGDGIEELAAVYGTWYIWFASGDKAEQINCGELFGVTETADGTFMNFYTPGIIGGVTVWYHLQDSTLVCSQPEDWYSARVFNSYETGDWYAEIMVGHDEERGYLWETVPLEFDKEKRQFVFMD